MQANDIFCWEEEDGWIGYLREYPDYWTQGETLEDLWGHLRDLYEDLNGGGAFCGGRGRAG
jgi:predicted RNase H-like HicB family nuclease